MAKRTKYGAIRTNGYDSKKEAKRAAELELMEKAGVSQFLEKQVEFVLIPAQYETIFEITKKGTTKPKQVCIERKCSYYADFTYYADDVFVVEDSKGMRLPDYKIKRKLMLQVHGIKIKET